MFGDRHGWARLGVVLTGVAGIVALVFLLRTIAPTG